MPFKYEALRSHRSIRLLKINAIDKKVSRFYGIMVEVGLDDLPVDYVLPVRLTSGDARN
jgi:hypothetical protein